MRTKPDYDVFDVALVKPDCPVSGSDSMLMKMDQGFAWLHANQPREFHKLLLQFATLSATLVGAKLSHGHWWVTTDPELVEQIGTVHDCPVCQQGTDDALAMLKAEPSKPVLCGLFYWADL